MKKYKEYMDGVTVPDTLHETLKNLEPPKKKPQAWKKYGAMAAALVLVAGLGIWGAGELNGRTEPGNSPVGETAQTEPAIEPGPMPDSPGMEMMGGYELTEGEMVAYYMLPYIEYGTVDNEMQADIALPVGVTRRDLTPEEIKALFGGETNLVSHLNWGDYTLYAHTMVWPDDSMWMLCVSGSKGDTGLEHFSLEVSPGQLPPSCLYYAEGQLNNIWERDVWAESYDSLQGSSRRVSFMDEGYGYRFEITGFKAGEISELVSRLVRWVIVGDGLLLNQNLDVPADEPFVEDPPSADPTEPVEEASTLPYDPSATQEPK